MKNTTNKDCEKTLEDKKVETDTSKGLKNLFDKLQAQRDLVREQSSRILEAAKDMEKLHDSLVTKNQDQHTKNNIALLQSFLSILDNLEAMNSDDHSNKLYRDFLERLYENGIKQFGQSGDLFNAQIHTVVSKEEHHALAGKVLRIVHPGYCMGTNLLRKAKIILAI